MTNDQFDALVRLIKDLAHEAVINARPMHNRLAKTDEGESAVELARFELVERDNG